MKRRLALALVLVLSTTMLYAQTAAPPVPGTGAVGRYQLTVVGTAGNNEAWLIDTQTGDTWRRQGNQWLYTGNPTQNPGPRFPAPRTLASRPPGTAPTTAPQLLPER